MQPTAPEGAEDSEVIHVPPVQRQPYHGDPHTFREQSPPRAMGESNVSSGGSSNPVGVNNTSPVRQTTGDSVSSVNASESSSSGQASIGDSASSGDRFKGVGSLSSVRSKSMRGKVRSYGSGSSNNVNVASGSSGFFSPPADDASKAVSNGQQMARPGMSVLQQQRYQARKASERSQDQQQWREQLEALSGRSATSRSTGSGSGSGKAESTGAAGSKSNSSGEEAKQKSKGKTQKKPVKNASFAHPFNPLEGLSLLPLLESMDKHPATILDPALALTYAASYYSFVNAKRRKEEGSNDAPLPDVPPELEAVQEETDVGRSASPGSDTPSAEMSRSPTEGSQIEEEDSEEDGTDGTDGTESAAGTSRLRNGGERVTEIDAARVAGQPSQASQPTQSTDDFARAQINLRQKVQNRPLRVYNNPCLREWMEGMPILTDILTDQASERLHAFFLDLDRNASLDTLVLDFKLPQKSHTPTRHRQPSVSQHDGDEVPSNQPHSLHFDTYLILPVTFVLITVSAATLSKAAKARYPRGLVVAIGHADYQASKIVRDVRNFVPSPESPNEVGTKDFATGIEHPLGEHDEEEPRKGDALAASKKAEAVMSRGKERSFIIIITGLR